MSDIFSEWRWTGPSELWKNLLMIHRKKVTSRFLCPNPILGIIWSQDCIPLHNMISTLYSPCSTTMSSNSVILAPCPPCSVHVGQGDTNLCQNFKDLVCRFPHDRFRGFNVSCSIQNIHSNYGRLLISKKKTWYYNMKYQKNSKLKIIPTSLYNPCNFIEKIFWTPFRCVSLPTISNI